MAPLEHPSADATILIAADENRGLGIVQVVAAREFFTHDSEGYVANLAIDA